MLTVAVSTAVTMIGIVIVIAATRTEDPTVALGLNRITRNAASYMSPSPSGRSGIAPGLCAAPSMPGGGTQAPGGGAYAAGAAGPGRYDGSGGGGGCHPGGGGPPTAPGSVMAASSQADRTVAQPRAAPCCW